MANCPSCSQNIKIEDSSYGTLFTCPHCQSVFFVGWDGQPETSSVQAESAAPISFVPEGEAIDPQAMDFLTPSSASLTPESNSENSFVPEPTNEDTFSIKENFNDVVEFANAVDDKGLITYNLTIEGIDLSDRKSVV